MSEPSARCQLFGNRKIYQLAENRHNCIVACSTCSLFVRISNEQSIRFDIIERNCGVRSSHSVFFSPQITFICWSVFVICWYVYQCQAIDLSFCLKLFCNPLLLLCTKFGFVRVLWNFGSSSVSSVEWYAVFKWFLAADQGNQWKTKSI